MYIWGLQACDAGGNKASSEKLNNTQAGMLQFVNS